MFIKKANGAFINKAFTSQRIRVMHPTMTRLYQATRELRQISTQTEVANAMNQSPQTLNNWESRGMSKKGMVLAQEVFGISASWLDTGRGPMLYESAQPESMEREFAMLRRLDVKASAGDGNLVFMETDKGRLAFRRDFLRHIGVRESDAVLIYADGQSMEPKIPDGAVLLVDTSHREMSNNEIHVIRVDGEILVKRLRKEIGGGVWIVSDNPDKGRYPDILVTPEKENHIDIIGRVLWMGARL
jgi:phage repressor protein C with HTH and peptisase S24 domain